MYDLTLTVVRFFIPLSRQLTEPHCLDLLPSVSNNFARSFSKEELLSREQRNCWGSLESAYVSGDMRFHGQEHNPHQYKVKKRCRNHGSLNTDFSPFILHQKR